MSNLNEEIPLWTWFNGQFLFQFDEALITNPNLSIAQFFNNFLKSQGLENQNFYNTKNQGTVILLMFGLLVIPREVWEQSNTNFQFITRNKFEIKIPINHENLGTLDFLRLLRNSLAHANFSLDTSTSRLTFWNYNKGTKNFEVEISYSYLGEFLAEVGKYYVNDVKNVKR